MSMIGSKLTESGDVGQISTESSESIASTATLLPSSVDLESTNQPSDTGESPKIPFRFDRGMLLFHHLIHLLPVAVTGSILSLSLKHVYFCDLGYPNLNSVLNAFQFGAKFHEILIAASLSTIVLYRLRYALWKADGLPFGLLTAGYQLSSLSYLFTKQFWSGTTMPSYVRGGARTLPLMPLLGLSFGLTAVVGPASAITLIPRLYWWQVMDPFAATNSATFVNTSVPTLTPSHITTDYLLGFPYDCSLSGAFTNTHCPSAGVYSVAFWDTFWFSQGLLPNITVGTDAGGQRYLTAAETNQSGNWSVSSTVKADAARRMGDFWSYALQEDLRITQMERPLLFQTAIGGMPIKKPIVQVQCTAFDPDVSKTVTFPYDQLISPEFDKLKAANLTRDFHFAETSWDLDNFAFEWVDLSESVGVRMLGIVFQFDRVNNSGLDARSERLACSIEAAWVDVEIWLDPNNDNVVHQSSADPLAIVKSSSYLSKADRITMGMDWVHLLTPPGVVWNYAYLRTLTYELVGLSYPQGNEIIFNVSSTRASYKWLFGTTVGMHVADGLSRVGEDTTTIVWHSDSTNKTQSAVYDLGDLEFGAQEWYPANKPFDVVARYNTTQWAQVTWEVRRFGYGWGMNSGTVIFAAVILLLHVFLVAAHIPFSIASRWTSTSWSTMGELVALTMNSPPDERLRNTSAGVHKLRTWQQRVRIRDVGSAKLQLVFANGFPEPEVGTKYC